MSSLAERLRARSERRPVYNLDDYSDDDNFLPGNSKSQGKIEKIVRDDAKDGSCQACGEAGDLLSCETCTYTYHVKCLLAPLKDPTPGSWRCPECYSPLNDIEKILDSELRPTAAPDKDASSLDSDQIFVKQYLVKWKGFSYLHCTWVPEDEFLKAFKSNPRLRIKVNNFKKQMECNNDSEDEYVAVRPEWTTIDRILACRGEDDEKEYLVKYKELGYDECYWEFEADISAFQPEIERFNEIQSRSRRMTKKKSGNQDDIDLKRKTKEFQHYEKSPEFLSGGSLHPYQLEGLNFLRFSFSKQTHVILADEMGLGKTIQSIAFLASLFGENLYPFLVVAPLSTLRNWEREFATWAPQMNVVMYVGSAQARSVIREYEFYYPKKHKVMKKKKSSHTVSESKQDRIKFDVLLTSYEMINLDSASLKPIKWECMIVDEGHRLKNKDSKLFLSLTQYVSYHRVLLTGTPLQNNLDELFMLMHFLDAGKFSSLEEFQEEFKDINQEEQVSRLHKMLAPHLLRRVKKDVMKELPPKKELILRVELTSKEKEYYKGILTRNYKILTKHGGGQVSLMNVVMQLRKLCCHPFLSGFEPDATDSNEAHKLLIESSGKLLLLDKMMVKLKEQGHRVLIYSQFRMMLDLIEDYCSYKKWQYERIDGMVGGAERQVRIDRFNAKNSTRFCFLLSTRAGGLGINLATADTVIIYDSDWNPHADLQAMARAHRLGQTNKVMIYRLITRGTIEERMMQMTRKKMVLEHLVVGKLKTQNLNQEELDDILRHGSQDLFVDENDEAGKSRQIHYDDAAIERLLDREQVGNDEAAINDEEEDGFLKAFKVANFEYIEESEAVTEEESRRAPVETKSTITNQEKANYWEELLKDRYEEYKVEEFETLGKGKRSRKQMVSVEDDDLAGLEDVSSDGGDDNFEAESTDGEANSSGGQTGKRLSKRKARADSSEIPLMEGEGKSLRVLGFSQRERAAFVQLMMRFGPGDNDWKEFLPRMKQKSYEEIRKYAVMFGNHLLEEQTDSPNFKDGVPKEGLRTEDVLIRLALLEMIREKGRFAERKPGIPLFSDDILLRYPTLKGGKFWKEEHDGFLLQAVMKHGYGRWQAIVDDKELKFPELICQELNLPFATPPVHRQLGIQVQGTASSAVNADGTAAIPVQGSSSGSQMPSDVSRGTTDAPGQPQLFPDSSSLSQYRDTLRRQVEFVKKRVLLLEKGLIAEMEKDFHAEEERAFQAANIVPIGLHETHAAACDENPDRLQLPPLYNKLCDIVENEITGASLDELEKVCLEMDQILAPAEPSKTVADNPPAEPSKTDANNPPDAMDDDASNSGDAKP